MRKAIPILILLACASGVARGQDDPEPPAGGVKALQGTWEVVKVIGERGGPPPGSVTITFKKDQMVVSLGKDERKTHTFKLDPKKKPAHLDITEDGRGKKLQGIYKLDRGELSICIGERLGRRPTKFDGSEDMVVVLKKRK